MTLPSAHFDFATCMPLSLTCSSSASTEAQKERIWSRVSRAEEWRGSKEASAREANLIAKAKALPVKRRTAPPVHGEQFDEY